MRTPLAAFFSILLQDRHNLGLQRQTEDLRVPIGQIHIQFAPDAEFAG